MVSAQEVIENDDLFREHLEEVWGKPPLPEGYRFNSIDFWIDGASMAYRTPDLNLLSPIDPNWDWTTIEVFFDEELVYAKINGIDEPILNRAPKHFGPNFEWS